MLIVDPLLELIWTTGPSTNARVRLAQAIGHIRLLAGNNRHIGNGGELKGGSDREQSPHELHAIADLHWPTATTRRRSRR